MRKVLILHRFYGKVDMGMKAGCIYKKVHFSVCERRKEVWAWAILPSGWTSPGSGSGI